MILKINYPSRQEPEEEKNLGPLPKAIGAYYQEPLSYGEESSRGVARGVDQLQALGYGAVGLAGDLVGSDTVKDFGLRGYERNMEEAAENMGTVAGFTDIEDGDDFVRWSIGTLAEFSPQLLMSIASGGVGAQIGRRAVAGAVKEFVERKTAEGVASGVAAETAKRIARIEAAEQITSRAMKAGIFAGGAATGVGQMTGSIYGDTQDAGLALKYGVPAGLIEGVWNLVIGGKLVDIGFGQQGKRGLVKGTLGLGALGSVIEGPGEELPQTYLEQMAKAEADPNYDINSPEAVKQRIDATAAGFLAGGAVGGTVGTLSELAPLTQRALRDRELPTLGRTILGEKKNEDQQQSPPQDSSLIPIQGLDGVFYRDQNPLALSAEIAGAALNARRINVGGANGINTIALVNPPEALKPSLFDLGDGVHFHMPFDPRGYRSAIQHLLDNGGRTPMAADGGRKVESESGESGLGGTSAIDYQPFKGWFGDDRGDTNLDRGVDEAETPSLKTFDPKFEGQSIKKSPLIQNAQNAVFILENSIDQEETDTVLSAFSDADLQEAKKLVAIATTELDLDVGQGQSDPGTKEARQRTDIGRAKEVKYWNDLSTALDNFEQTKTEARLRGWIERKLGKPAPEGTEEAPDNSSILAELVKKKRESRGSAEPSPFDLASLESSLQQTLKVRDDASALAELDETTRSADAVDQWFNVEYPKLNKQLVEAQNLAKSAKTEEDKTAARDLIQETTDQILAGDRNVRETIRNANPQVDLLAGPLLQKLTAENRNLDTVKANELVKLAAGLKPDVDAVRSEKSKLEQAARERGAAPFVRAVYTSPQTGQRVFGALVPTEDGKIKDEEGNYLFRPLRQGATVYEGDIKISPDKIGNLRPDDLGSLNDRLVQFIGNRADTVNTSLVENIFIASQLRSQDQKAVVDRREAEIQNRADQSVVDEVESYKDGEKISLVFPGDSNKLFNNDVFIDGVQYRPTNLGVFRGTTKPQTAVSPQQRVEEKILKRFKDQGEPEPLAQIPAVEKTSYYSGYSAGQVAKPIAPPFVPDSTSYNTWLQGYFAGRNKSESGWIDKRLAEVQREKSSKEDERVAFDRIYIKVGDPNQVPQSGRSRSLPEAISGQLIRGSEIKGLYQDNRKNELVSKVDWKFLSRLASEEKYDDLVFKGDQVSAGGSFTNRGPLTSPRPTLKYPQGVPKNVIAQALTNDVGYQRLIAEVTPEKIEEFRERTVYRNRTPEEIESLVEYKELVQQKTAERVAAGETAKKAKEAAAAEALKLLNPDAFTVEVTTQEKEETILQKKKRADQKRREIMSSLKTAQDTSLQKTTSIETGTIADVVSATVELTPWEAEISTILNNPRIKSLTEGEFNSELRRMGFSVSEAAPTSVFEIGGKLRETKSYETTLTDPRTGVEIPLRVGLFRPKNAPDGTGVAVKSHVEINEDFAPLKEVIEAQREFINWQNKAGNALNSRRLSKGQQQTLNANLAVAAQSKLKAEQNLRRVVLAAMNTGLDVRIPSAPVPQGQEATAPKFSNFLSGLGIQAEGTAKQGFLVTRVDYNSNPAGNPAEYQVLRDKSATSFIRDLRKPAQSQQQAAATFRADTIQKGRSTSINTRVGLGSADIALENVRAKLIERAEGRRLRDQENMAKGLLLEARVGNLTKILNPLGKRIYDRWLSEAKSFIASATRSEGSDFGDGTALSGRWFNEAQVELLKRIAEIQRSVLSESDSAKLTTELNKARARMEAVRPEKGFKVSRKTATWGKKTALENPQSESKFREENAKWEAELESNLSEVESNFYAKTIPRAVSGTSGVGALNAYTQARQAAFKSLVEQQQKTPVLMYPDGVVPDSVVEEELRKNKQYQEKVKNANASTTKKIKRNALLAQAETLRQQTVETLKGRKRNPTKEEASQAVNERLQSSQLEPEYLDAERRSKVPVKQKEGRAGWKHTELLQDLGFTKQEDKSWSIAPSNKNLVQAIQTLDSAIERSKGVEKDFDATLNILEGLAEGRKGVLETKKMEALNKALRNIEEARKKGADPRDLRQKRRRVNEDDDRVRQMTDEELDFFEREGIKVEEQAEYDRLIEEGAPEFTASQLDEILRMERGDYDKNEIDRLKDQFRQENADSGVELKNRSQLEEERSRRLQNAGPRILSEDYFDAYVKATEDEAAQKRKTAKQTAKQQATMPEGQKELARLYAQMLDQALGTSLFGFGRGKKSPPGLVRRAGYRAVRWKRVREGLQREELFDEKGKTVDLGSERGSELIKGQADPLAAPLSVDSREESRAQGKIYNLVEDWIRKESGMTGRPGKDAARRVLSGAELDQRVEDATRAMFNLTEEEATGLGVFLGARKGTMDQFRLGEQTIKKVAPWYSETGATPTQEGKPQISKYATDLMRSKGLIQSAAVPKQPQGEVNAAEFNKNATPQPGNIPVNAEQSKAARSRFVQDYTGLTDAEMLKFTEQEIDAAYRAASSNASSKNAELALDSVVQVTPSMETLLSLSTADLIEGYKVSLEASRKEGGLIDPVIERLTGKRGEGYAAERQLNTAMLLKTRAFGNYETFLRHVANDANIPRAQRLTAKQYLDSQKSGFKWRDVAMQIASFATANNKKAPWAGLVGMSADSKGGMAVYINTDAYHDGSPIQTMLHEADHILSFANVYAEQFGITLNETQTNARESLRQKWNEALLKAGEKLIADGVIDGKQTASLSAEQKRDFFSTEISRLALNDGNLRPYAGLATLAEFVTEAKVSNEFRSLLADLGFNKPVQGDQKFRLGAWLKDLFRSVAELVTGRRIDPSSELAKIYEDSWELSKDRNFAVQPSQLAKSLGIDSANLGEANSTVPTTGNPEGATLKSGNKNYQLDLVEENGKYFVRSQWGVDGRKMQSSKSPLATYKQAKTYFDKKLAQKTNKGYARVNQPETGANTFVFNPPTVTPAPVSETPLIFPEIDDQKKIGLISEVLSLDETSKEVTQEERVKAEDNISELTGINREDIEYVRAGASKVFRNKATGEYIKLITPSKSKIDDIKRQIEFLKENAGDYVITPNIQPLILDQEGGGAFLLIQKPAGIEGIQVDLIKGRSKAEEKNDRQLQEKLFNQTILGGAAQDNGILRVETDRSLKNLGLIVGDDGMVRAYGFDFDGVTQDTFDQYSESAAEIAKRAGPMKGVPLSEFSKAAQEVILSGQSAPPDNTGGSTPPTPPEGPKSLSRAMASVKAVVSNIDEAIAKLQIPDLKNSDRFEATAKSFSSRTLIDLGRSADRIREEANLAQRELFRLGSIFNLFSFEERKIAQERFNILASKSRELNKQFLGLQSAELEKSVFKAGLEITKQADETVKKFEDAFEEMALLNEATEIINRPEEFTPPMSAAASPDRGLVSRLMSGGAKEVVTSTGDRVRFSGWFESEKGVTEEVADFYSRSVSTRKAAQRKIESLATILSKRLKGAQDIPLKTVQTALGSIENPLTSEQAKEVRELEKDGMQRDADELRDEYRALNLEGFRRRQEEAMTQLPDNIAEIVGEMRGHIDTLGQQTKESEGIENGVAVTIDANRGVYLNRSYLVFQDAATAEKHRKAVRNNPRLMADASDFIRRRLLDEKANAAVRRAFREGTVISEEDARARQTVSDDEIARGIERLLNVNEQGFGRIIMAGRIPGQKTGETLRIFDQRGNIDAVVQKLWGVIEDPVTNYVNTALKMSAFIANDQFLTSLRDAGTDNGLLYDPLNPESFSEEDRALYDEALEAALDENPNLLDESRLNKQKLRTALAKQNPVLLSVFEQAERNVPRGYVKLSGENNKSLAPVSGLYAQEDLAKWMFEKYPPGGSQAQEGWVRVLGTLTMLPMAMKTVGSVVGQVRNFLSGGLFLVAGDNANFMDSEWRQNFGEGLRMTFGDAWGKLESAPDRKKLMDRIEELGKEGVTNQSLGANLVNDVLQLRRAALIPDANESEMAMLQLLGHRLNKGLMKTRDLFVDSYGASDDFVKIITYISELGKYRRAMPNMSEQQLKQKVAKIARDIHPTYSDTYAFTKGLKRQPFIAPFISFTSEVIRTSVNLVKLSNAEIREGKETGNDELAKIGWGRRRGMVAAALGPSVLAMGVAAMAGIKGDDEEDLRRFLPDWQKSNQLLIYGKSNGKLKFVDISFTDPYSYLKTPIVAVMNAAFSQDEATAGERMKDMVVGALGQVFAPWSGEQLFTGAIMDIARNKDATGREIVNWQDSGANIAGGITNHIWKTFRPGTLDSLGRVLSAAKGEISGGGRSYDFGNEMLGFLGTRPREVDVRQALGFKASQFMSDYRDASSIFTGELLTRGTRAPGKVAEAYRRANDSTRRLVREFSDVIKAAGRQGANQGEIRSILKGANISDEMIKAIATGKFKYEPSKQAITRAIEAGNTARVREAQAAMR